MLDPNDKQTSCSIRALRDIAKEQKRPLILWIGGGVSKWCGYPLWRELADTFHSKYLRSEGRYEKSRALTLLERGPLPDFFQLCQATNRKRYYQLLADSFAPRPLLPVYSRFLELLRRNEHLWIVTTNVDEMLEKDLPNVSTVQRSDFERVIDLIQQKESFVCKLHGSISSLESTVFTTEEYASLLAAKSYRVLVELLFMQATVVFLGYSLGDSYVLNALQTSDDYRPILGSGPHFAVVSESSLTLPSNILPIRYVSDIHTDHRSALQVLDIIHGARASEVGAPATPQSSTAARPVSAYYISDFFPPGTWTTSQSIEATGEDSSVINVVTGTGFIDREWPIKVSTAMHDLTVGLICFDLVYMPTGALGMVHNFPGPQLFWLLIDSGALRFIHSTREIGVLYHGKPGENVKGGSLGAVGILSKDTLELRSVTEVIRKTLQPLPGKEREAETLFEKLESAILVLDYSVTSGLLDLTKAALLHPHVRKNLGISDAFLPSNIPRWNVFPVLRLAHVVSVAQICAHLSIPAVKIGFGGETLAGISFSVAAAGDLVDDVASYVLSGHYDTDLGSFVENDPAILAGILKFRETSEGVLLRKEVAKLLDAHSGSEFVAAVNGGMKRNIPSRILEVARNQMSGVLVAETGKNVITPAVWNNLPASDSVLRLWRSRCAEQFSNYCQEGRIGRYDLCPCGSGEKRRFCCEVALTG